MASTAAPGPSARVSPLRWGSRRPELADLERTSPDSTSHGMCGRVIQSSAPSVCVPVWHILGSQWPELGESSDLWAHIDPVFAAVLT